MERDPMYERNCRLDALRILSFVIDLRHSRNAVETASRGEVVERSSFYHDEKGGTLYKIVSYEEKGKALNTVKVDVYLKDYNQTFGFNIPIDYHEKESHRIPGDFYNVDSKSISRSAVDILSATAISKEAFDLYISSKESLLADALNFRKPSL